MASFKDIWRDLKNTTVVKSFKKIIALEPREPTARSQRGYLDWDHGVTFTPGTRKDRFKKIPQPVANENLPENYYQFTRMNQVPAILLPDGKIEINLEKARKIVPGFTDAEHHKVDSSKTPDNGGDHPRRSEELLRTTPTAAPPTQTDQALTALRDAANYVKGKVLRRFRD